MPQSEKDTKAMKLELIKGIHYKDYAQSGENIEVEYLADNVFRFTIYSGSLYHNEPIEAYQPFILDSFTDYSAVPVEVLHEFDTQMYYCGESNCKERQAKFSTVRKNIQAEINARNEIDVKLKQTGWKITEKGKAYTKAIKQCPEIIPHLFPEKK